MFEDRDIWNDFYDWIYSKGERKKKKKTDVQEKKKTEEKKNFEPVWILWCAFKCEDLV